VVYKPSDPRSGETEQNSQMSQGFQKDKEMDHTESQSFAVIFDMDGVIVDNMEYHKKAWAIFLEKYAPGVDLEEFSKHFGKVNRDLLKIVFTKEVSEEEESRFGEEKEAIYREIYADHIVPVAGLLDLLDSLKENSFKTAVATAAPRVNMDFVFEKTGLRKYFDVLIDATEVTRGKPDPEIYLKVAQRLGYLPDSCLVFEDSFPGVQAAKEAGMKVIALATSHSADRLQNAESVIKDFTEINLETVLNYLITVE